MSGPVNVLAVMGRAVEAMNDAPQVPPFMSDELYKARAAVAELIDLAEEAHAALVDAGFDDGENNLLGLLDAALARAGGAL